MKFKQLNNYIGWLVFVISAFVYLSTIESTASFWDCGEFITAGYRMEIGHAPGAPFFLLLTKLFTLLAGNDTSKVAIMTNSLSALASAATIMFLFWTITHLARKLFVTNKLNTIQTLVIIGSGLAGALSFMFTDTFWFSAVEAEVYATSSFITAIVFWAILKWENVADQPHANRWIILIAFLMGISIGVHLLNLLAIPAIVFVYYFRKYLPSTKGVLKTLAVAAGLLGSVIFIFIPGTIKVATWFELFFVNDMHMPYYSGLLIYISILLLIVIYAIYRSYYKKKVLLNTIFTAIAVMLIGYSSYAVILIRSEANPPMDQNNPQNPFSLLSYINRDQYGSRPLFYGPYFNSEITDQKPGKKIYIQKNGRYSSPARNYIDKYKPGERTLFPRMYSNQPNHIRGYMRWAKMDPGDLYYYLTNENGQVITYPDGSPVIDYQKKRRVPTTVENLRFLFRYQLGYMYFRYFMWNFSGRQNDDQGLFKEDVDKGNWITGIKTLDARRLGNQDKLTSNMLNDKSRNTYFMLPLILGLIGMFYHYKARKKDFWVVMLLFFFTGLAIVLYLNQPPVEPRERDYVFVGSFYAFAIWIGFSVVALYHAAKDVKFSSFVKLLLPAVFINFVLLVIDAVSNNDITGSPTYISLTAILLLLLILFRLINIITKNEKIVLGAIFILVSANIILLGTNNWNDHDRSGRTFVRDIASNYLNSCEKNAVLFTYGDNDTYPLWYAQEVEGIRTDIRVLNLSYLSTQWYIELLKRKIYQSDPIKLTLSVNDYETGKRMATILDTSNKTDFSLKEAIAFTAGKKSEIKNRPELRYIPQNKFYISVDTNELIKYTVIPLSEISKATDTMQWQIDYPQIYKNQLVFLDILASNLWERPVYIASTVPENNYLNLQKYFELHGLAYRIVPVEGSNHYTGLGRINTDVMYDNMMHKFKWGNVADPHVFIDENTGRMLSNLRMNFALLAAQLIEENKPDRAREIMDKCFEVIPESKLPLENQMYLMAINYYNINEPETAVSILNRIIKNITEEINYYTSLDEYRMRYFINDLKNSYEILEKITEFRNNLISNSLTEQEK